MRRIILKDRFGTAMLRDNYVCLLLSNYTARGGLLRGFKGNNKIDLEVELVFMMHLFILDLRLILIGTHDYAEEEEVIQESFHFTHFYYLHNTLKMSFFK